MESKLQSLRVPELKELLQKADLATTGNKPDLIKRLLENPSAIESLSEPEAAPPAESSTADEAAQQAPAASAAPAEAPAASEAAAAPAPAAETSAPTDDGASAADERKRTQLEELQKRKARALRFGEPVDDIERKIQRIERFGLEDKDAVGIQKIDAELRGAKRGHDAKDERQAKAPKPAAPAKAEISEEELAARRRRAERFGLPLKGEDDEKRKQREARFGTQ
ncbi:hypothetical protein MCUN1_003298 [Malassezia cuniculi]|uniref:SAP domain-containing protein n=1 Tax=Malassezia cuniculi TaxID=948313 RepID=A0AAF0J850_9BASI|nr:hypothetical protein MCUN1_003298 [Malassezia cuniculi]